MSLSIQFSPFEGVIKQEPARLLSKKNRRDGFRGITLTKIVRTHVEIHQRKFVRMRDCFFDRSFSAIFCRGARIFWLCGDLGMPNTMLAVVKSGPAPGAEIRQVAIPVIGRTAVSTK